MSAYDAFFRFIIFHWILQNRDRELFLFGVCIVCVCVLCKIVYALPIHKRTQAKCVREIIRNKSRDRTEMHGTSLNESFDDCKWIVYVVAIDVFFSVVNLQSYFLCGDTIRNADNANKPSIS